MMTGAPLNVSVTADTTQMRAQLLVAQAQLKSFAAAGREAAAELTGMGPPTAAATAKLEQAAVGINAAKLAVSGLKTGLGETSAAMGAATAATKNHGAATEAMVLVHEAMSGRFTKMAGSAMILSSRLQGATLAMTGLVGAFAVGAMAAAHLVEWLNKISAAKLLAQAGGVGSGISTADIDAQVDKLRKVKEVSTEAAGAAVHALDTLPGMSHEVMDQVTTDLRTLSLRMGDDVPAAAKKVGEAWNLNAVAGADLLNKTRASTEAVQAFVKASQEGEAIKARTILLKEMARSTAEVTAQTKISSEINSDAAMKAKLLKDMGAASRAMGGTSKGEDTAAQAIAAAESTANANRLASALSNVSAVVKGAEVTSWSQRVDADLQKAVFTTEQAAHAQGQTWQKIHEGMADTTVKFWQGQVAQTTAGTKNREDAERKLMTALEAQDMAHVKADTTGAKQALHEQLSALTEQQAAHRNDFQVVMQIEDQKITLLRGAGKEYTAELNRELTARENLIRENAAKIAGIDRKTISEQIADSHAAFEVQRSDLAAEVSEHMITKQSEIAQLKSMADVEFVVNNLRLQNFIDVQDKETAAYRDAIDEQKALARDHARTLATLDAQMAAADRADQQRTLAGYQQMFQGVGSASKGAVESMITGAMTWQQAEGNVAKQVVGSMVSLGTEVVAKWAAVELAKTLYTDRGVAQRVVAEQSEGQSGWGALLAKWIGLETSKTTATEVGAMARAAAEGTADSAGMGTIAVNAIKSIAAGAGKTFAGIFGFLAPEVGPAAAGPAAAGSAAVMAVAGSIPSFAVGAWNIPNNMLANIHAGEMIIPAGPAAAIRAGGSGSGMVAAGGGGDTHHWHVNAVDAGSFVALLNGNADHLARAVTRSLSNNPSLRPRY